MIWKSIVHNFCLFEFWSRGQSECSTILKLNFQLEVILTCELYIYMIIFITFQDFIRRKHCQQPTKYSLSNILTLERQRNKYFLNIIEKQRRIRVRERILNLYLSCSFWYNFEGKMIELSKRTLSMISLLLIDF